MVSGTDQRNTQPLSPPMSFDVLHSDGRQLSQGWQAFILTMAHKIDANAAQQAFPSPLSVDGAAGSPVLLEFTTGGTVRWAIGLDAGANFVLIHYADNGSSMPVMTVNRSTQQITWSAQAAFVVAGKVGFNNAVPQGPVGMKLGDVNSTQAALVSLGLCRITS